MVGRWGRTWAMVLREEITAETATLAAWPVRPAELARLADFADVILGVFRGEVVAAYDITSWRLETEAERERAAREWRRHFPRVVFEGTPWQTWAHLIGTSSPGRPWTQWPVQYLDAAALQRH